MKASSDQKIVLDFLKENFLTNSHLDDRIEEAERDFLNKVAEEINKIRIDFDRKIQENKEVQKEKKKVKEPKS